MEALVREVAQEFLPDYPSIQVAIGNMPAAHGDATLLRQVYVNLIGNALKYSSRAAMPCVEVGVEAYGAAPAVYFVRDNGIGFDMAYVERLFRPFERLHSDRDFRGAGIGLALANLIVQRHGGRIWAEGVPDKGAVFRFTLGG
jgi:light-regulated signal transduction histidine kinase (bacteriophytochrome)